MSYIPYETVSYCEAFAMSEFNGDTPGDVAEAYAAGFEQGKNEEGE